jgi:sugar phosphate isomerase/epimerase
LICEPIEHALPGLTRRALLASLATPLLAPSLLGAAKPQAGCQTNAWRIDAKDPQSFPAVLDKIRGYGYAGFETSFRNFEGRSPDFKSRLNQTGLKLIGVHIWTPQYGPNGVPETDLIARVITMGATFGAERLIISGAPATAGIGPKAAAINAAHQAAKAAGLGFAYHNHGPEVANNAAELNEILKRTDAPLLLDAGHAYLGGADPAKFFQQHHGRIAGIHLRDFKARDQVILGEGEVDYKPLAAAIRSAKWSGWVMNEEERLSDVKPGDSAVQPARAALKKLFGV